MTPQEFGLLFISTLLSVLGQFFLKLGALKLVKIPSSNLIKYILNIAITPELVGGLFFYGLGAIAYIMLLSRVNLSVAGPSAAIMYVFSVLLGYFAFQETLPFSRLVGLGFIVCGVILVAWQHQGTS
jgi:drug/metabolite transporter (DMT)-like permease